MKRLMCIFLLIFLTGCSGKIYTVEDPQFKDNKGEKRTKGVLFYGYKIEQDTIVLDRIRHPKTGDITHSMYEPEGSAKHCCKAIKVVDKVVMDYEKPYAVYYEPGLFETNKFGVALDKGTLKSVNSESTPGVKTAVESLQGLVNVIKSTSTSAIESLDEPKCLPCTTNK